MSKKLFKSMIFKLIIYKQWNSHWRPLKWAFNVILKVILNALLALDHEFINSALKGLRIDHKYEQMRRL